MSTEENFLKIVTQHVESVLVGEGEFERLREFSFFGKNMFLGETDPVLAALATPDIDLTPAEAVRAGYSTTNLAALGDYSGFLPDRQEVVGKVEGHPIFYVDGQGVYFISGERWLHVVQLTVPCLPPGW